MCKKLNFFASKKDFKLLRTQSNLMQMNALEDLKK
jgi:hypothetical protein